MTPREHRQREVEQMLAEQDRREEERRVTGIDWSGRADPEREKPVAIPPPPHRESHTVTVVCVTAGVRTRHRHSILANDRDHAEFMALAYHRGGPHELYYVDNSI